MNHGLKVGDRIQVLRHLVELDQPESQVVNGPSPENTVTGKRSLPIAPEPESVTQRTRDQINVRDLNWHDIRSGTFRPSNMHTGDVVVMFDLDTIGKLVETPHFQTQIFSFHTSDVMKHLHDLALKPNAFIGFL